MAQLSKVQMSRLSSTLEDKWFRIKAVEEQQAFFGKYGDVLYDSFRRRLPSICNLLLQDFCECFNDEDGKCNNDTELKILRWKIDNALGSDPAGEENKQLIDIIYNLIAQDQKVGEILMGLLYVIIEVKDENGKSSPLPVPVFRIPNNAKGKKCKEEHCFIDHSGRFYFGWNDFIETNKLPKSRLCYPKNGLYTTDSLGNIQLCFGKTPASKLSKKVLNHVDMAASVAGLGAGVAGIGAAIFATALAPVVIPCVVVSGVVGGYGVVRSSVELADRGQHKESLTDRESARHWLSIVGSALGIGSAGGLAMVKYMANEGIIASKIFNGVVNGVNGSSLVVNGIGVAEGVTNLVLKRWRKQDISNLEVAQVVLSALFFSHAAVSIKTAGAVYRETQAKTIDAHRASLKTGFQKKMFDKMMKKSVNSAGDPVIGKATVIRYMKHVSNSNEFYAQVLKKGRKENFSQEKLKLANLLAEQYSQPSMAHTSAETVSGNIGNQVPQLFQELLIFLGRKVLSENLNYFLSKVDDLCLKYPYGKQFRDLLYILIDCFYCRNIFDAQQIIRNLIAFCQDLYEEWLSRNKTNDSTSEEKETEDSFENLSDTSEERGTEDSLEDVYHSSEEGETEDTFEDLSPEVSIEEIIEEIMEDAEVVPGAISAVGQLINKPLVEEEVYHFPNHRKWGESGVLNRDEYILIGKNALGVSNVECEDFKSSGDTGVVYFKNHGVVIILSCVEDERVVVKTITFQRED